MEQIRTITVELGCRGSKAEMIFSSATYILICNQINLLLLRFKQCNVIYNSLVVAGRNAPITFVFTDFTLGL